MISLIITETNKAMTYFVLEIFRDNVKSHYMSIVNFLVSFVKVTQKHCFAHSRKTFLFFYFELLPPCCEKHTNVLHVIFGPGNDGVSTKNKGKIAYGVIRQRYTVI